jgi:transposase-like protein
MLAHPLGEGSPPKLCDWVEENVGETLSYYRLPLAHHKHLKSTNMLERLNQEIKRRTHVVRIFSNAAICLRLVRALAVETHEDWLEATRYLNAILTLFQHGAPGGAQNSSDARSQNSSDARSR